MILKLRVYFLLTILDLSDNHFLQYAEPGLTCQNLWRELLTNLKLNLTKINSDRRKFSISRKVTILFSSAPQILNFLTTTPTYFSCERSSCGFKFLFMLITLIFLNSCGSVLDNDFWTPPPLINFVHDLDFTYFQQKKNIYFVLFQGYRTIYCPSAVARTDF